jgi:hypothetical protein
VDIETALWAFKMDPTDRTGMSERQLTPAECVMVAVAESCARQEAILAKMAKGVDGYGDVLMTNPETGSSVLLIPIAETERARSYRFKKVSARRLGRGERV